MRQRASRTTKELEKAEREVTSSRTKETSRLLSTWHTSSPTISHRENLSNIYREKEVTSSRMRETSRLLSTWHTSSPAGRT